MPDVRADVPLGGSVRLYTKNTHFAVIGRKRRILWIL